MADDPRGPNQDTSTIRVIRDRDTPTRRDRAARLARWVVTVAGSPFEWPVFAVGAFLAAAFFIGYGVGRVQTRPAEAAAYGPNALATQQAALAGIVPEATMPVWAAEEPAGAFSGRGGMLVPPTTVAAGSGVPGGSGGSTIPDAPTLDVPWLPPTVVRWRNLIEASAARYGVDPDLLGIIVTIESGGGVNATSGSGAMSLGQVMRFHFTARQDPYDPATNLDVAARVLADCLSRFGIASEGEPWARSVEGAAGCYVGGGPNGTDPQNVRYRRYVRRMWAERHDPTSAMFVEWCGLGGQALIDKAAQ